MKYKLGQHISDIITGFSGFITGRVEYLTGCAQYLVQPKIKKEGDFVEARWFDENRIQVADVTAFADIVIPKSDSSKDNGPDVAAPIK